MFCSPQEGDSEKQKQIIGYLNLFANAVDNFTHGLAVAASFIAGNKVS
jgi:zinc transporter 13